MKKGILLLLAGWLVGPSGRAQYLFGVSGSNYAGTNALYHNPAQVADSRHKLFVNLTTGDLFLTNNYIAWNAPYSMLSVLTNSVPAGYRSSRGAILYRDEYFGENLNGRPKHLYLGGDLRGPSVLYTVSDRIGVAVTSRVRFLSSFAHVSEPLARILRYGTAEQERVAPQAFGTRLDVNVDGYAEIGGTLGAVLLNSDVDFLKAGLTVKRLVGLYSGHVLADGLDYRYVPDPADASRDNILLERVHARYGFTSEAAFKNFRPTPQTLLGRQAAGAGWGFDLGLVYEFRPDVSKYDYREKGEAKLDPGANKYRYRVSVALLDLGGIRYRNPAYVSAYDLTRTNRLLDGQTLGKLDGADRLTNNLNQVLGATPDDRQTSFRSALPTTLQASVDVKFRENVYINAAWVQRLRGSNAIGAVVPNVIALTPRYERKGLEVAAPLSFYNDYQAITLGLALRLGPLFVGTDHLPGLLNVGRPRGMDVYAGASVPLFRRRPAGPDACWYERGEKRGLQKLFFWKK
jgi:hypothetical protein